MRDGRILQAGAPSEIYLHPRHAFVVRFVGVANVVPCRITGTDRVECAGRSLEVRPNGHTGDAENTVLTWRPEHSVVSAGAVEGLSARLVGASFLGPVVRLKLRLDGGDLVSADRAARDWFADPWEPGTALALTVDPAFATVLPADESEPQDA